MNNPKSNIKGLRIKFKHQRIKNKASSIKYPSINLRSIRCDLKIQTINLEVLCNLFFLINKIQKSKDPRIQIKDPRIQVKDPMINIKDLKINDQKIKTRWTFFRVKLVFEFEFEIS